MSCLAQVDLIASEVRTEQVVEFVMHPEEVG